MDLSALETDRRSFLQAGASAVFSTLTAPAALGQVLLNDTAPAFAPEVVAATLSPKTAIALRSVFHAVDAIRQQVSSLHSSVWTYVIRDTSYPGADLSKTFEDQIATKFNKIPFLANAFNDNAAVIQSAQQEVSSVLKTFIAKEFALREKEFSSRMPVIYQTFAQYMDDPEILETQKTWLQEYLLPTLQGSPISTGAELLCKLKAQETDEKTRGDLMHICSSAMQHLQYSEGWATEDSFPGYINHAIRIFNDRQTMLAQELDKLAQSFGAFSYQEFLIFRDAPRFSVISHAGTKDSIFDFTPDLTKQRITETLTRMQSLWSREATEYAHSFKNDQKTERGARSAHVLQFIDQHLPQMLQRLCDKLSSNRDLSQAPDSYIEAYLTAQWQKLHAYGNDIY